MKDYFGDYYMRGLLLHVFQRGEELVAGMPYVPQGYEIILEPLQKDRFRLRGGPAHGAVVEFVRDLAGQVQSVKAGEFEILRVEDGKLAEIPVVGRFPAPEMVMTPEKEQAFRALLETVLAGQGDWIDYSLPYPKYEFVEYIKNQQIAIFHGTGDFEIEEFIPLRSSTELYDTTGRGNKLAVYGTHEGLWAMFFAVVDRKNITGSIRNGVAYFYNQAGNQLALYNFSINQDYLDKHPWRTGALYILPRAPFRRLMLTQDAYANEWASEEKVRPYAKLMVKPEDWPFLDKVEGHDDGLLIRVAEIGEAIKQAATQASLEEDAFTVWFNQGAISSDDLDYYVSAQRMILPASPISLVIEEGQYKLTAANLQPAVKQGLRDSYKDKLNNDSPPA